MVRDTTLPMTGVLRKNVVSCAIFDVRTTNSSKTADVDLENITNWYMSRVLEFSTIGSGVFCSFRG